LILFWPTSTSPLRWEWQWTNVKWNCKSGMFALATFLKSGAREFTTIEIDKFVGTKIWSSKTRFVGFKHPCCISRNTWGKI
jgi:hypothetical protein